MPTRTVEALEELRKGSNPFSTSVAAVGSTTESLQTHVRTHTERQLSDLLAIIHSYRTGSTNTRIYPVVGDPGSGKTHLLYVLRHELTQRAIQSSEETLLVVVEHLAPGVEPVDYLLWQIANHMLSKQGDGGRIVQAVAGRLTGRLLAESLRRLSPPQQIELIPADGYWQKIRMGFGSAALAQERIAAVAQLIEVCDSSPEPIALREACSTAGITAERAIHAIANHLEQSHSRNTTDWFRKELYRRLADIALLDKRDAFDALLNGEIEPPSFAVEAGSTNRCMLDTWLELLANLNIPVAVVFDQLEDYLRATTQEQQVSKKNDFIRAITSLVDRVKGVCVFAFSAMTVWIDLMNNCADTYARDRLAQPFSLPGQASRLRLEMPEKVTMPVVEELVATRLKAGFPGLDLTGLPAGFPFSKSDLTDLTTEKTVRGCIFEMTKRFDRIVYQTPVEPREVATRLKTKLQTLWSSQLQLERLKHGGDLPNQINAIPDFQNALVGWLQILLNEATTGSQPWASVEVVTCPERSQYGYLTVVRSDANEPGIGIAAWLGQKAAKYHNLVAALSYFKDNPCPIRTLIVLREEGEAALTAKAGEEFNKAKREGRDVRIAKLDAGFYHALMGISVWYQAALAEVESVPPTGTDANAVFRELLAEISRPLLACLERAGE